MECNILENILIERTSSENYILELINSSDNKELNNEDIMSILYPVLNWEIEGDVVILKGEALMPADENITISKHHRFISIPNHKHDFIELSYVYKGSLTQVISGKTITLKEGEMCILDMNVEHSISASSEDDIIINCLMRKDYFDTSLFSRISSNDLMSNFLVRAIYDSKDSNNYCIFKSSKNNKIKRLMKELICEFYSRSICFNEVINCYIILIFSELLEVYKNQTKEVSILNEKTNTSNITEILKYIESNHGDATLTSIADTFHFHPNYISALIKKTTGRTFKEIIHEQKLKKASSLLKNTKLNIDEIAIEVGYNNKSFFYKKFKHYFGLTPQEYRLKTEYK